MTQQYSPVLLPSHSNPRLPLRKQDVTADDDTLVVGVIVAIGLGALFVAGEDGLETSIVQLLEPWLRDLHIRDAPECLQVVDRGHLVVPRLVWHLAVECSRWSSIEDVHHSGHDLTPEVARQHLRLQHTPRHVDDALIGLLDHPILLWRLWGSQLMLDIMFGVVPPELNGGELPPTIGARRLEFPARLHLDRRLEVLDCHQRLILTGQQLNPHVAAHVVHQQKKVVAAAWCRGSDFPA
jgi:hypothetical protein